MKDYYIYYCMINSGEQGLQKSQTQSIALPKINKLSLNRKNKAKSSRYDQKSNSFMAKLKAISPENDQYEYMETTSINQEQQKLKNMLRQFNQETYEVIKSFMHRSKNLNNKPRGNSTSAIDIKTKQIQNNNNMIQICGYQMDVLKRKCENLKYLSVEEFQKKINKLKEEIEQIRNQNKAITKGNILRGLSMAKDNNKIKEIINLQNDKNVFLLKKSKLQVQSQHIIRQSEAVKERQLKIVIELQKNQVLYQAVLKKEQQRENILKKAQDIKEKQKLKTNHKTKNTAISSKNQHIYLQTLKELEQTVKSVKKIEQDIEKTSEELGNSKKQMEILQKKLQLIKNSSINKSITLLSPKQK